MDVVTLKKSDICADLRSDDSYALLAYPSSDTKGDGNK